MACSRSRCFESEDSRGTTEVAQRQRLCRAGAQRDVYQDAGRGRVETRLQVAQGEVLDGRLPAVQDYAGRTPRRVVEARIDSRLSMGYRLVQPHIVVAVLVGCQDQRLRERRAVDGDRHVRQRGRLAVAVTVRRDCAGQLAHGGRDAGGHLDRQVGHVVGRIVHELELGIVDAGRDRRAVQGDVHRHAPTRPVRLPSVGASLSQGTSAPAHRLAVSPDCTW